MNILTIGAYERDNFGDELFYIVLKKRYKFINFVPTSMIYADMSGYFEEYVFPYKLLINKWAWDAIWVVGGEVGGADIDSSLNKSLSTQSYQLYHTSNQISRNMLKDMMGVQNDENAYIPNLDNSTINNGTTLVLNSVGGLSQLKRSPNIIRALKNQSRKTCISVRDVDSVEYLKSNNIKTTLCPDVVHTIKDFVDAEQKSNYVCFQISKDIINHTSIEKVAQQIVDIEKNFKTSVLLVQAGAAEGHDDIVEYEKIVEKVRQKNPKTDITIANNRNPMFIAKTIAQSRLWIGSSLHGRIIASTFEVPRVSLKKQKVTNYAQQWDDKHPYDVEISQIITKAKQALGVNPVENKAIAERLYKLALKNLNDIMKFIKEGNKNDSRKPTHSELFNELIQYQYNVFQNTIESYNQEYTSNIILKEQNRQLSKELHERSEALKHIQQSTSWKITSPLRKASRFARNIVTKDRKAQR